MSTTAEVGRGVVYSPLSHYDATSCFHFILSSLSQPLHPALPLFDPRMGHSHWREHSSRAAYVRLVRCQVGRVHERIRNAIDCGGTKFVSLEDESLHNLARLIRIARQSMARLLFHRSLSQKRHVIILIEVFILLYLNARASESGRVRSVGRGMAVSCVGGMLVQQAHGKARRSRRRWEKGLAASLSSRDAGVSLHVSEHRKSRRGSAPTWTYLAHTPFPGPLSSSPPTTSSGRGTLSWPPPGLDHPAKSRGSQESSQKNARMSATNTYCSNAWPMLYLRNPSQALRRDFSLVFFFVALDFLFGEKVLEKTVKLGLGSVAPLFLGDLLEV